MVLSCEVTNCHKSIDTVYTSLRPIFETYFFRPIFAYLWVQIVAAVTSYLRIDNGVFACRDEIDGVRREFSARALMLRKKLSCAESEAHYILHLPIY